MFIGYIKYFNSTLQIFEYLEKGFDTETACHNWIDIVKNQCKFFNYRICYSYTACV